MMLLLLLLGLTLVWLGWLALSYRASDHSQYDLPAAALVIAEQAVSPAHDQVVAKLQSYAKQPSRNTTAARQRLEELFYQDVPAQIVPVDVDGIASEWVLAEEANPERRLLYLHGGAFRVGSPRSHRHLTNQLSQKTGCAVLAIDYRMMPEHKLKYCHEDTQTAYRWILANGPNGPCSPAAVFVAGDSAGGNLTLSVIAWARDQGLRAADGALAFAPATDSTFSSPTWVNNRATDPFLGPSIGRVLALPKFVLHLVSRVTAGLPPNHPMLSPLLGSLANLPPTLIQVSCDEMLYGDAQRYANKAIAQGSDITLQVWPKMVHVFQAFPELPEAEDALIRAAEFINRLG